MLRAVLSGAGFRCRHSHAESRSEERCVPQGEQSQKEGTMSAVPRLAPHG